jgi:hypothetical protein
MAFQITEVQKALKGVTIRPARRSWPAAPSATVAAASWSTPLRSMNKDCFDGPNAVMKELKGSRTGSGG